MNTEVYISDLNGNRAAVRSYAHTIAEVSASSSNAYVMAFDKDNQILWTVQSVNLEDVNEIINWKGVCRVEIYDHSVDGSYKVEHVYVTSKKSLNEYTSERNAADFEVVQNNTQYSADNWEEDNDSESDDNGTQSNESSEMEQEPAEPSAQYKEVAKVAENVKAYAALIAANRANISARAWLRASHEFCAQDGDPIRCTGWQFIGYNIAAAVSVLLLFIEY